MSRIFVFLGVSLLSTLLITQFNPTLRIPPSIPITDLTQDQLVNHADQIATLTSTGLELTTEGRSFLIPAQNKDLSLQGDLLRFNADFLNYVLTITETQINEPVENLTIESADFNTVFKATVSGHVHDGKEVIKPLLVAQIFKALSLGETTVEIPIEKLPGQILNETGIDLGPMELLATGQSDFSGSPGGRTDNVKLALDEHFNGILIPPGAEFSYVAFLGPIESSAGWKTAYNIKKGQLEHALGGGICQVSTTVYRAALEAGLPITEQRNHSLYVDYYEEFGDGLDATVFPGEQDLKFVNDTPNYLLMEATHDGTIATIKLYGESDGRSTTLVGPYTASNESEAILAEFGNLGIGDILWQYTLSSATGIQETRWLESVYHSPVKQYREAPTPLQ